MMMTTITLMIIIIITIIVYLTMSSCLRAIARVHPVHSMNADSAPTSDQAKQLGL